MTEWNMIHAPVKQTGTIAEVYINKDQTLIKKEYKVGGITVSGHPTQYTEEQINNAFHNEAYWLETLEGKWVPELISAEDNIIVQKYYGTDLLDQYMSGTLHKNIPNLKEQVIEMYTFFKENNVFKRNGSLSNLTVHNNQLIAFDFKWAKERPEGIDLEMRSYNEWLCKIDKSLPEILKEMI
jgi:RIO-like serine/threonine protein kinase